ncbi:MAG: serine/threonine protein kinase [Deltaproteobacteria bacterium]|nr:serine/threonine protein kinase [Deltaproteobacteria bacterium]
MVEMDSGQSLSRLPEQFGKYSLLGHLATGGMAEVYLARQTGLQGFEKIVVIKCVRGELEQDGQTTGFFLDEARLVATLEHPNIAQVYEIGQVNNSYFFVMEYVQGADLRQMMELLNKRKERVPIAEAIFIAIQVCAALHYAHEKTDVDGVSLNIIHRDVSPSNVLISHDGAVKLCDFGIAKAQNRTTETQGGVLKGKYSYMSPEQCRCEELDRRSDVFAMGIVLYELTTLKRAFNSSSDFELLQAIVNTPTQKPSERVPDYPAELERIVMRALEKDRDKRYQSTQELQLDLETFARENKLPQSSIHLAKLMGGLFEKRADMRTRTSTPIAIPRLAEGTDDHTENDVDIEVATSAGGWRKHGTPTAPGPLPIARGSKEQAIAYPEAAEPVRLPAPPKRSARGLWLVGALVCGLGGAGAMFAGSVKDKPTDEHKIAIDASVDKVVSAFENTARSAQLKATGIVTSPVLRAAIETDATTMKDIVANEYMFTPAKGEVIEIFQIRGSELVSLVRLPATAPALRPLKAGEMSVELTPQGPVVVAGAPIAGTKAKTAGVLVVSAPVDLSASRRSLDGHVKAAWIEGLDKNPIAVTGTPVTDGQPLTIPLPVNSDWNTKDASLRAVPLATALAATPAWMAPAQYSAFGAAGLFVLIFLVSFLRRNNAS